ncbi:SDR family oxidoreductase [Actinomycetospora sp. TBRC 11914]|uniref:SDR family NAD(P)-dependent oxidoreductase n=1 Tax=Actinomycetospora sp. TBRC 11914 TaxID=2729387 RepID=UPI00145F1F35|nr:SDR family oxidoreductase [Actinomycetospora sp. TBRC 11914]NMO92059.1 SDR family oxidoreductase [Actinomycetospora sp. TBRC 11914]
MTGPIARPVALVTGASSGIGTEFATQLAGRGHDLVLVARDEARLEALATELRGRGSHAEVLVADLADPAARARVERRLADPGDAAPVDLLVNNAGYGTAGEFIETDPAVLAANHEVNVTAVLLLCRAALPGMVARGRGGVINTSSVAGFLPGRGSVYGAGKAYVTALSQNLFMSVYGTGVHVMALCPGYTKTEFHERFGQGRPGPGFLWLEADRVVADALADYDRRRELSVPGAVYKAIVAGSRLVPLPILQRLARRSASGRG